MRDLIGLRCLSKYTDTSTPVADLPNATPFTSILSLDVQKDAGCDPARIMSLYGMSKDFGANGFRAGALVCQHNDALMRALRSTAMMRRMGSPTVHLLFCLLQTADADN